MLHNRVLYGPQPLVPDTPLRKEINQHFAQQQGNP